MLMKQGGIYIYFFRNTGLDDCEQSYVGSSVDLVQRNRTHLNELTNNKHPNNNFQRAYNKYGSENMTYEILEKINFPKNYSRQYKREYLEGREYMYYSQLGCLYNKCVPGQVFKLSVIKRDYKTKKGNPKKKPVYLVDDQLNVLAKFGGIREAGRYLGLGIGGISAVAYLKQKDTKGKLFRFEETLQKSFVAVKKPNLLIGRSREFLRKPVLCYSVKGEFLAEYDGVVTAAKILRLDSAAITKCCKDRRKYVVKYIFRFKNSDVPVVPIIPREKRIVICHINGEFYKEYGSERKAAKDLGLTPGAPRHSCKRGIPHKGKYQFYYKNQ